MSRSEDQIDDAGGGAAAASSSGNAAATRPGLASWLFSFNALFCVLCLLTRFYNTSDADTSPVVESPEFGPFGDFVIQHVFNADSSLGWSLLLIAVVITVTHSEPEKCRDLQGFDRLLARHFILHPTFFWFVFAGPEFNKVLERGDALTLFFEYFISFVSSDMPRTEDHTRAVFIILAEAQQFLGLFLYYALYKGLASQSKAVIVFNILYVALLVMDAYECVRDDGCTETVSLPGDFEVSKFTLAWVSTMGTMHFFLASCMQKAF